MARRKNTKAAGTYAIDLTKRPGLQGFTAIYWNGEQLETYNVATGWYCKVDATHWMSGGYDDVAPFCCDCADKAAADAASLEVAELAAKVEAARLSLAGLTNALTDEAKHFGFTHPIEVVTVGNLPGAVSLVCDVEDDRASRELLTHIGATVVCGKPAYTKRPGRSGEVTWLLDSYGYRRRTQTPTITLPEVPSLGIASILDEIADAADDCSTASEQYGEAAAELAWATWEYKADELHGIAARHTDAATRLAVAEQKLLEAGYIPGGVTNPALCQHGIDVHNYCSQPGCSWF